MTYRSERFDVGELAGLGQVFGAIDILEAAGLKVESEVMAGNSYRRQLASYTKSAGIDASYVLQATLHLPPYQDGSRWTLSHHLEEARRVLGSQELPGDVSVDPGSVIAKDIANQPFGAPDSEDNVIDVFPAWLKTSWAEKGRACLFYCGILPPQPKGFWEEYRFDWDERLMRRGAVVFSPTPQKALERSRV